MARVFLRQTMIALRARRQAYRIAADFLYEDPIDVETIECESCRQPIHVIEVNRWGNVCCPACGTWNRPPDHLRSRRVPEITDIPPFRHTISMEELRRRRRNAIIILIALFLTLLVAIYVSNLPH